MSSITGWFIGNMRKSTAREGDLEEGEHLLEKAVSVYPILCRSLPGEEEGTD